MGLFSKIFSKKEKTSADSNIIPQREHEPKQEKIEVRSLPNFPVHKDGHPIRYAYVLPFIAAESVNVAQDVLGDIEKEVNVQSEGDRIALLYNGMVFGYIENANKAEMVSDWQRKQLPCSAILLRSGDKVNLRFYHDKRIGAEYREQTIHKLTGCKSDKKQESIWCMSVGDELSLEEDFDHEGSVLVFCCATGDAIGKLPKKVAERFLQEGAYAAYIETLDDDEEGRTIPSIRIYW